MGAHSEICISYGAGYEPLDEPVIVCLSSPSLNKNNKRTDKKECLILRRGRDARRRTVCFKWLKTQSIVF